MKKEVKKKVQSNKKLLPKVKAGLLRLAEIYDNRLARLMFIAIYGIVWPILVVVIGTSSDVYKLFSRVEALEDHLDATEAILETQKEINRDQQEINNRLLEYIEEDKEAKIRLEEKIDRILLR